MDSDGKYFSQSTQNLIKTGGACSERELPAVMEQLPSKRFMSGRKFH